tara:strand:+ start:3773 stop:4441 length:669 start_codon:yes stop_codon:yes gene_type:complete
MRELVNVIRNGWESLDVEPLETQLGKIEKDDLTINNEMYKCKGLRKIHLETATAGKLNIVHTVFWPDPNYNIPIFGCDIVSVGNIITAAIVDISPIRGCEDIYDEISVVSNSFQFSERRPLPLWADEIFSPFCKFVKLTQPAEKIEFLRITKEYLDIFIKRVKESKYDETWVRTMLRYDDQIWYAKQQRKNKKTLAVLSKWFDDDWASTYIDEVLFDVPKIH